MAIDAHSTTAPVVQMGLLPAGFSGAVPLPTPDLTAETVALLTEVFPEIGKNPEVRADVRHGGAPICSAADLPCGAAGDVRYDGTGDAAQALHMRRALEGALDHGTALLAALGLPSLVEPGFMPLDPAAIGDAIHLAIATLDVLDAAGVDLEDDGEAEPSLGWIDGKPTLSDSHDDREAEDDNEPILGAPERHPSCYQFALCDATSSQEHWADGSARNDEAKAVNEDGTDLDAGELDEADLEPSLGAPEVAFGRHEPFRVDQTHWAGGDLSDLELNDIDKPADLDGLHEQFAGTGLVPALEWTAGGYVG